MRYIYAHFGELVGVTAAVIVALLVGFFGSVAIAVRAVATLAVMEVAVWGAATAIYSEGLLGSGGVLHTLTGAYGLFFYMPILAFSLVTGLGLDYDIFLLTSVVEERAAGWSDADAVSVGLLRSGPVISIAGVCAQAPPPARARLQTRPLRRRIWQALSCAWHSGASCSARSRC